MPGGVKALKAGVIGLGVIGADVEMLGPVVS